MVSQEDPEIDKYRRELSDGGYLTNGTHHAARVERKNVASHAYEMMNIVLPGARILIVLRVSVEVAENCIVHKVTERNEHEMFLDVKAVQLIIIVVEPVRVGLSIGIKE